jgi:hypothetical protein
VTLHFQHLSTKQAWDAVEHIETEHSPPSLVPGAANKGLFGDKSGEVRSMSCTWVAQVD